ncbi:MAG: 4-hydroxy-tetrahydrodipicolinate synthase [Lysobacteraceae bacterium]
MQLRGSITALATPFTLAGGIDFAALRAMIERQIAAGTRALVIAGSTGEAAMLAEDEYRALLSQAVDMVAGRIPVLAGSGQSGTARSIAQTRLARDCGIAAALVVTPPYVRPTQAGLAAHYRAVAAEGGLPLLLYNVPGRTGVDLLPETVAELASVPGIIGIKEAVPEAARIDALLPLRRDGFVVLSGDDPTALRSLLQGADGVVSVASNAVPAAFARLCNLAAAGDADGARALDQALRALYDFLGCAPNPIPLKAVLAELGLCEDALRLPLLPLTAALRGGLDALAAAVGELDARSMA